MYLCRLHNESASRLPRTGDFILQQSLDSCIYVFYHRHTTHKPRIKVQETNKRKAKLQRKRNNSSMPEVTLDLEERAAGLP